MYQPLVLLLCTAVAITSGFLLQPANTLSITKSINGKSRVTTYMSKGFGAKPEVAIAPKVEDSDPCPCSSGKKYGECCEKFHKGMTASNPVDLLRSRFSAFTVANVNYILDTTHPTCPEYAAEANAGKRKRWARGNQDYVKTYNFENLEIEDEAGVLERAKKAIEECNGDVASVRTAISFKYDLLGGAKMRDKRAEVSEFRLQEIEKGRETDQAIAINVNGGEKHFKWLYSRALSMQQANNE